MPASETPRQTHISSVDETESAPVEEEAGTLVDREREKTVEELHEGTAPGKD